MFEIVKGILIVIEVICSFLLIVVILVQKTKGSGMGMAFGSAMGESLFGAQVGNVLTKTTVILGIIFLVNTTVLALIGAGTRGGSVTDGMESAAPVPMQGSPDAGGLPPSPQPMGPAPMPPMGDAPAVEVPAAAPAPMPAPAPTPLPTAEPVQ